jgi:hypothetical protein
VENKQFQPIYAEFQPLWAPPFLLAVMDAGSSILLLLPVNALPFVSFSFDFGYAKKLIPTCSPSGKELLKSYQRV